MASSTQRFNSGTPKNGRTLATLTVWAGLIASTVNLFGAIGANSPAGITEGDFRRAILLGTVYGLACVILCLNMRVSYRVLRGEWLIACAVPIMAMSVFWSLFPGRVLTATGHVLGYLLIACAMTLWTQGDHKAVARALVAPGTLILCVSVVVALIAPNIGIDTSSGHARWSGITEHPNTLGEVALIVVCCAAVLLSEHNRPMKAIQLWAVIAIAVLVLVKSDCKTASVIAATMIVAAFSINVLRWTRSMAMTVGIVFLCGIIVLLLVAIASPELMTVDGFLAAIGRNRTLTGRMTIWESALRAHALKPYLGWSYDKLASLSPYGLKVVQFHNGYLDLMVRGGYVGIAFMGLVLLQLGRRIWRLYRFDPIGAAWYSALVVACLGHNVTEATLMRAPSAMWMALCIVVFSVGQALRVRQTRRLPQVPLVSPSPGYRAALDRLPVTSPRPLLPRRL